MFLIKTLNRMVSKIVLKVLRSYTKFFGGSRHNSDFFNHFTMQSVDGSTQSVKGHFCAPLTSNS